MAEIRETADGVYRIKITSSSMDIGHVNLYMIESTDSSYILVDAGFHSSSKEVIQAIQDNIGKDIRVETLVITHLHYDHYGGVREIAGRFASKTILHEREVVIKEMIENVSRANKLVWADYLEIPSAVADKVQKLVKHEAKIFPQNFETIPNGYTLKTKIGSWEIIHTPGHTPGHVCLFNWENGILISGDHLLPEETSNVAYYPVADYNPLFDYLKSLRRVEGLNPRVILPSHGEPFKEAGKRVEFLFQHHLQRLEQVFTGIRNEKTIIGVARHVKWSRGDFDNLTEFDKWLAVLETISHAEFLRFCGVVERGEETKLRYRVVDDSFEKVEKTVLGIV